MRHASAFGARPRLKHVVGAGKEARPFRALRLVEPVVHAQRLDLAEPRNGDDVDVVVVVRAEGWDVLAAVKFFDQGGKDVAQGDDQDDLALVFAEHLGHEGNDFVRIPGRYIEFEAFGHGGGGFLGSAVVAGVDGVDAGDDVDVLDDVGKQFGALLAEAAEGRIVAKVRFDVGMADENQRRGGLLLKEPGKPDTDDNECGDRAQPRSAPLNPSHWHSKFSSAPKHTRLLAVPIPDRTLLDDSVFDLDDVALGFPSPSALPWTTAWPSWRSSPLMTRSAGLVTQPPEPNVQHQPRDDREAENESQNDRAQHDGAHCNDGADNQTGQLQQWIPGHRESVHSPIILPLRY